MFNEYSFKKFISSSKGSSPVMVSCIIIIVVAVSAFITDIGYVSFERVSLDKMARSLAMDAALALSQDRDDILQLVTDIAAGFSKGISSLNVKIAENKRELSIYLRKPAKYLFISILGLKPTTLSSTGKIRLVPITALKQVKPLSVLQTDVVSEVKSRFYLFDGQRNADSSKALIPLNLNNDFMVNLKFGCPFDIRVNDVFPNQVLSVNDMDVSTYLESISGIGEVTFILPVVEKNESTYKIIGFTAFSPQKAGIEGDRIYVEGFFVKSAVLAAQTDAIAVEYGLLGIEFIN